MNYSSPTYISFYATAFLSLALVFFLDKATLAFVYPLPVLAIFWTYMKHKSDGMNFFYVLSLVCVLFGGMLLLMGLRKYVPEVSIIFSIFYVCLLRLMYVKNLKQKNERVFYFRILLFMLPIIYIYDRVMCLIYEEIRDDFVYFSVLIILILIYIVVSLYYYLRNKNEANLWMLTASFNLGVMNIIIILNELILSEVMFTFIALFCSYLMLFFTLQFMLADSTFRTSYQE